MPAISPTYASPGLRLGLLQEDHPGARVEFDLRSGTDLGIPEQFGGDQNFCVATIIFPASSGKPPIEGWKPAPNRGSADEWNVLCTKTMGRALKRAGYPDDTQDLRALVVWRQREAEIGAIKAGTAQLALPPAPLEKAIEAAGSKNPERVSVDDGEAPDTVTDDDGIADAELIDEEPPKSITVERMRKALAELGPKSKDVTTWAKKQKYRVSNPATEDEAQAILNYATTLAGVNPETGEIVEASPEAADIAELVAGLDEKEMVNFLAFCKTMSIDAAIATNSPANLTNDQCQELLGWFEAG